MGRRRDDGFQVGSAYRRAWNDVNDVSMQTGYEPEPYPLDVEKEDVSMQSADSVPLGGEVTDPDMPDLNDEDTDDEDSRSSFHTAKSYFSSPPSQIILRTTPRYASEGVEIIGGQGRWCTQETKADSA